MAIGANFVLTKDVPDRAVVMGIPAQIVNFKGSAEYVDYRNRSTDASINSAAETATAAIENSKL